MPEADSQTNKNFFENVPVPDQGFFLKGSAGYDWGMKNRLSRIFRPDTGHTVMLAIDHGYFQGPTTGLERVDVTILPLAPYADALMCTRGILRSTIPPSHRGGVVIRASGGPSILKELSNEHTAVNIEDAVRMNVHAVAVQVFIGGEFETQSIQNLTKLVDDGYRVGIPVLGVTAVGKELLSLLVEHGFVPVLACLGCDEQGHVLNINADIVANQVALATKARALLLVSDVSGVLRDVADPRSRIPRMTREDGKRAIETGVVTKGMIPKLEESFAALAEGVRRIHIVGRLSPGDLVREAAAPGSVGTVLVST